MKKLLAIACMISLSLTMNAQVKMPAPSPTQTIQQDFGTGSIELKYSRPSAKGRTIFGDLVPFNKIWRTGANGATRIKFADAVEIKGKKIDTGSYVLYTIPGIDSWEIIINKGLSNWGIDGYSEADDVARFKIEPMKMKTMIETFTMQFANIKAESCELHIMWENTAVAIPINIKIKDKIKAQIDAALQSEKKPYWQAAQFYNEYEKNLPKALEYATKAAEENTKAYWILLYKAKIQLEMGDKEGAMVSSKKSMELAMADKNDDYVKMNEELQKKLK